MVSGSDDRPVDGALGRSPVSRRETLAAIGGAALASWNGRSGTVAADRGSDAPVRIRVYPGRMPIHARARYGLDELQVDWPAPFRDALAAVEDAFEQVLAYARERDRLETLEVGVERAAPIRFPPAPSLSVDAVLPSLESLLERVGDRLRARDALTGRACHLYCHWSPLNYRVGYGGTLSPNALTGVVGEGDTGDALTVANVGATEVWDSRAVTRNVAIHEAVHTFLSDDVVAAVGEARCDHELGTAVRTDDRTLEVSPIATAYAGPDRLGGGTRFPGTGCADRDRFYRHEGTDGVEEWTYTTDLSPATCEAVTRFLERRFEN